MDIARHRLRNQRLAGDGFERPADAVRWLGAVQAQDYRGATWAIAMRTPGVDSHGVDDAFNAGQFVRTHVLRPTWHVVAPEDIRWLLALTGARVLAGSAARLRQLELDAGTLRATDQILVNALEGGRARTRRELGAEISAAGISPAGQRLPYLLAHAELTGLICSGPLQGRQHTFALLEERVPPAPPKARDEALAELVRRYLRSHGPATVHDFAWWSGLTVRDGRSGLEAISGEVEPTTIDGKTYWVADPGSSTEGRRPAGEAVAIHLLPNYDELTVAYRDHGPSIDPRARDVFGGWAAGVLSDVVAVNGLIVGRWRRSVTSDGIRISADVAVGPSSSEHAGLEEAAERYGRFAGQRAHLQLRPPSEGPRFLASP